MDDGGPAASTLLLFLLIGIDFILNAFGAAMDGLNPKELVRRNEEEGTKQLKRLLRLFQSPDRFTFMAGATNAATSLAVGAYCLPSLIRFFDRHFLDFSLRGGRILLPAWLAYALAALLSFLILLLLILVFGNWLPRRLGSRRPDAWAIRLVTPVYGLTILLAPFSWLVRSLTTLVLRLFGIREKSDLADVTEEEILSMVNEGHEQGVLQASEAEMISNIFDFTDKQAKDIMTNRTNIEALNGETTFREAIRLMAKGHNSRFPVYLDTIDHIIGILHLKDAYQLENEDPSSLDRPVRDVPGLLREAKFVPQTIMIDRLFRTMQSTKLQIVIVVDEYGQTAGLLTMEDILEEIVGNIADEYDEEELPIQERGKDEYVMDAMTRLEDLEEKLGISFGEGEFETLNGFLISKMDKIPEAGDEFSVEVGSYRFRVMSVEHNRVGKVLVTRLNDDNQS